MRFLSKIFSRSLSRSITRPPAPPPFRCIPKYIPKIISNTENSNANFENQRLFLRRFYGDPDNKMYYFSALSGPNFSPEYELHPPFPKTAPYPVDLVGGGYDGLMCLEDNETAGNVVLWNPTTNKFKFLPPSSVQRLDGAASTSPQCSGFGYDRRSEDYKLIRFVNNYFEYEPGVYDHTEVQVELYSLKTDSWKEIPDPKMGPWSSPSAYVDGVFYWVATGSTCHLILSFDFSKEEFSSIAFPRTGKKLIGGSHFLELFEFCGSLSAVVYPLLGTEKCFEIWVLVDNSLWTRVCDFCVPGAESPLGFWGEDEVFLEGINRELLVFNLGTRELKNLGIYEYPDAMRLTPYMDSTVPLIG